MIAHWLARLFRFNADMRKSTLLAGESFIEWYYIACVANLVIRSNPIF